MCHDRPNNEVILPVQLDPMVQVVLDCRPVLVLLLVLVRQGVPAGQEGLKPNFKGIRQCLGKKRLELLL